MFWQHKARNTCCLHELTRGLHFAALASAGIIIELSAFEQLHTHTLSTYLQPRRSDNPIYPLPWPLYWQQSLFPILDTLLPSGHILQTSQRNTNSWTSMPKVYAPTHPLSRVHLLSSLFHMRKNVAILRNAASSFSSSRFPLPFFEVQCSKEEMLCSL